MEKKKKKKSKKKVKKSKKGIIDNLKIVETNFLQNYKLPSPMDKAGILSLSVNFKNKYGAIRYGFLGLTERGLYAAACLIQGKAKSKKAKKKKRTMKTAKKTTTKKKGKKPLAYTPAECKWFKEYKIPKVFGEKAEQKLAEDHEKKFPNLPRRTSQALAWKLMNLCGRWNPKGKPGEPKKTKRTKKKTTKRRRSLMAGGKHRYTPNQENYLMLRIPKRRNFRHGELRKIARVFNAAFKTSLNYKVIGIKCSRLREKLRGITKTELRLRITETTELLKSLGEEDQKLKETVKTVTSSKALKKPVSAPGQHIVVDTVTDEIIWRGDHKPANYCVCGGILQGNSVCTVIIDNEALQNIFKDHKPELDYFHK